jgi:hypothetical protein
MYEERITLWQAEDFDQAVSLAEAEAEEYAGTDAEYLGLAQAYWLHGAPTSGAEVFSLVRDSSLAPTEYLNVFFDTGQEHEKDLPD